MYTSRNGDSYATRLPVDRLDKILPLGGRSNNRIQLLINWLGLIHTIEHTSSYLSLVMWAPGKLPKVVDFLASMGKNKNLSLECLSRKLCLLMTLVAASCTSELHALDLRFQVFKPKGILFKLSTLTKKGKVGAPLKECFFGAFTEDKGLCMVECLREYERRTLEFQQCSS